MEKILVVTGDSAFGERLSKALSDDGYIVSIGSTVAAGINMMSDKLPNLLLLDIVLSDGEGYGILEKKSIEPLLAKIPVFLMSTQGVPINMRSVPQGSVTEFIAAMNIDPKDIVAKINEHFGKSAAEPAKTKPIGQGKTILWVEDDKLIGNILGKKLMSSGFNLLHAVNGEEALKMLEETIPDAIVVDLLLPGMSGFDIVQKIRTDGRLKKVPIMILSNLSKPGDIDKAHKLGAQKFLVKATASLDQIVSEVHDLSA